MLSFNLYSATAICHITY